MANMISRLFYLFSINVTMLQKNKTSRAAKAYQLFQTNAVKKIHDDLYFVRSQKNPEVEYEIVPSLNVCSCRDFERTGLFLNFFCVLRANLQDSADSSNSRTCKYSGSLG